MKKYLYIIIGFGLSITSTHGFDARPFVINEITNTDIIVSDLQTSLISTYINRNTIQGILPNIEPGIIVMIQCTPDKKIQISNASDQQSGEFNAIFEKIAGFFAGYDEKFVQKVKNIYKDSPRENYIIKALLSNRLPAVEFNSLQYNISKGYTIKSLNDYCFTRPNKINELLGRDRLFLNTIGKDLTQSSKIISRSQRGADESMNMPVPPSTGTTPSNPTGHTPSNVNTIRANYSKNFEPMDKPRTIMHSVNGIRRPLEYFPADRIIIHHTAGGYKATAQEGQEYMQSLQIYHGRTLGRGDIGYHFLIDGEGNVYEGRRGGMHTVGAHALGHNRGSVGISLMSDKYYSSKMLLSLIDLIIFLGQEYQIDVGGQSVLKNADLSGTEIGNNLIAHKEIDKGKPLDPAIPMDVLRKIINRVKNAGPLTQKVYEK